MNVLRGRGLSRVLTASQCDEIGRATPRGLDLFSDAIWRRSGLAPTFTLAEDLYSSTEPSNSVSPPAKAVVF